MAGIQFDNSCCQQDFLLLPENEISQEYFKIILRFLSGNKYQQENLRKCQSKNPKIFETI